ncbi:MAG: type II toxin-antitoxin system RelE/ParE family toxin [Alphaproteobacteria bacterium]
MDVVSIRHRGLRRFFERGEARGLSPDRVEKIRRIMTAIDNAATLDELDTMPGWRLHRLHGDRRGTWSISVSGNWRLTFRIEDHQIFDLDLEDYH